jgi:hypothetical protein
MDDGIVPFEEATVLHRLAFKRAHEEPLNKLALVGTDQIVGPSMACLSAPMRMSESATRPKNVAERPNRFVPRSRSAVRHHRISELRTPCLQTCLNLTNKQLASANKLHHFNHPIGCKSAVFQAILTFDGHRQDSALRPENQLHTATNLAFSGEGFTLSDNEAIRAH